MLTPLTRIPDREKINTIKTALVISIVLLVIKFVAWFATDSNAILTDALESIVNVVAGVFALFSIYYASQPRDENHPYGYGKMEFLSAGFEGGLIFIAGIGIMGNAVYSLFLPPTIHSPDLGAYLSAAAGLINLFMGIILVRKGKQGNSLLMIANGKHLISDTISSAGLVVGLFIIYFTGWNWLDQLFAIIFGLVIFVTGFKLMKKSVTSLLDEADYEKLEMIISLLETNRSDKWIDIHNLRVIKYGSDLHVDCHITLPWYDTLEKVHEEVTNVEMLMKKNLGSDVEFFIHSDPCLPPGMCTICQLNSCEYRQANFQKRMKWDMSNLLPNKKHTL